MSKIFGRTAALAVLASVAAFAIPAGASASAGPVVSADCDKTPTSTATCVRWCYIADGNSDFRHPCGIDNEPNTSLSGRYTASVPMSGAVQTASGIPGEAGATGTANLTFDLTNNRFCATTTWSGISSKVAAGHIHQGSYGQPENPAVWISLMNPDFINGHQSGVSYCETVPAAEMRAIVNCPREFHTVVHSQNHPAGAIRGQLGTACKIV